MQFVINIKMIVQQVISVNENKDFEAR